MKPTRNQGGGKANHVQIVFLFFIFLESEFIYRNTCRLCSESFSKYFFCLPHLLVFTPLSSDQTQASSFTPRTPLLAAPVTVVPLAVRPGAGVNTATSLCHVCSLSLLPTLIRDAQPSLVVANVHLASCQGATNAVTSANTDNDL